MGNLKSVRNRINKGFTGTGLKIPKSENRKPSHGEGVCRGKISYETYDRETLGCKPDILVKTWCTGLMEKNKILGSQDNTKIVRILEVKESCKNY